MKYAKIIYRPKEKNKNEYIKEEGIEEYFTAETKEEIEIHAYNELKEIQEEEKAEYNLEITYIFAEEYNKVRREKIEMRIKNSYLKYVGEDENITIFDALVNRNDIEVYNKALDFYIKREQIKDQILKIVDPSIISIEDFNEYVDKLYKAIGTEKYSELINKLKTNQINDIN